MTKDDIFVQIKEVLVSEFKIDESAVTLEANLYEDLELDSIDAVDLLVHMKKHVQGKIVPEQFKKARTIQDVIDVIHPLT